MSTAYTETAASELVQENKRSDFLNSPELSEKRTSLYDEAEIDSYKPRNAAILAAVCLLFALIGLDENILGTAVPSITKQFGTIADVGWYHSVYRFAGGSYQFLFGKLYTVFPIKRVMLASLAIFVSGSLLCSVAETSLMFIAGRLLTGFATAGVTAGAFALIIATTDLAGRPAYAGLAGAVETVAALVAPFIGGVLSDSLSWRFCYLIQMPLVAFAFLLICSLDPWHIREEKESNAFFSLSAKIDQLDLFGTLFFIPLITSLLLTLQWTGGEYGWGDQRVTFTLIGFAVLTVIFAYMQYRRKDRATLPPRILFRRNVLLGFWFSSCNNGALAAIEFYMPTYFQVVRRLSPSVSGLMLLPIAIGYVVSTPIGGMVTSHLGYYNPTMILTSVLMPVVTCLLTTLKAQGHLMTTLCYLAALGLAGGVGFQGPQVAVQAVLSDQDAQIGIAIIQFAQAMGSSVSVTMTQVILKSQLLANVKLYAPDLDASKLIQQGLAASIDSNDERISMVFDRSLMSAFLLPVLLSTLTIIPAFSMQWKSIKGNKIKL